MKVQDIMTSCVQACAPDTNLAAAAALMWETDCGVLPVVADGSQVIGVVTDRDIAIALGTRNRLPAETPVSEAMSVVVHSCAPTDDIHAALQTMAKEKVRRLPVVNRDGELAGILCMNDIVLNAQRAVKRTADLSFEDVVTALKAICEHRRVSAAATRQQ